MQLHQEGWLSTQQKVGAGLLLKVTLDIDLICPFKNATAVRWQKFRKNRLSRSRPVLQPLRSAVLHSAESASVAREVTTVPC